MTRFTGRLSAILLAASALAAPASSLACACGCGIFDIGDIAMTPNASATGFSAWFRYARMEQDRNLAGTRATGPDANDDKRITTDFYTFGAQYAVNHNWMLMAELPLYDRAFTTTDDGTVAGPAGTVATRRLTALGDMTLTATYTGLTPDMSNGLSLGVKLPTGRDHSPLGALGGETFDHDTLPGTGSTDLLVGAWHVGRFSGLSRATWFAQARYQAAVANRAVYRPGDEANAAVGAAYDLAGGGGLVSRFAPGLMLLQNWRGRDSGSEADTANTGYERIAIAPSIDARIRKVRLHAEIAIPIYQNVRYDHAAALSGDSHGQLVAPSFFKLQASYDF